VSHVKISYCVQCDVAEFDDAQELPKRCFPLNREEVRAQANVLVEPRAVVKLVKAIKKFPPIVLCYEMEYFEPCLPAEVSTIQNFQYCFVEKLIETNIHEIGSIQSVKILNCSLKVLETRMKRPYEEIYIRPLITLHPKPSYPTPDPPQHPSYVRRLRAKTEKPVTILDVPQLMKPELPKLQASEEAKQRVKFSTSTALYTPAKPAYSTYQYKYSHRETYLTTSRARSEYRERSVGRRTYVSLYY
jgi:hypothetical protein